MTTSDLRRPRGAWLAAALLVGACTTTPTPRPSAAIPAATTMATPTDPASPSAEPTGGAVPTPGEPPALAFERVADGFTAPIGLAIDGDGRLYVNEQAGRVMSVGADGEPATFLDIRDRVTAGGERGLLGLAFHPDWPRTDRIFVHYTDADTNTALSEFRLVAGSPSADPASERRLLTVPDPAGNHNGGQLAFGPDGYLYMGIGDGGGGGDTYRTGQDPGDLLGNILRIDIDRAAPYAIPADNPFVDDGGAPEVWIYGLRNPWRFSFDRLTGDLWIGDVGQGAWEEVTRLAPDAAAGANLGWPVLEGAHCFGPSECATEGLVGPLAEYGHDQGRSVIGGHVYRGAAVPGLFGWYVFADFYSGLVFGVPSDASKADDAAVTPRVLVASGLAIAAFAEDADGELLVVDTGGGAVYRIVAL